MNKMNELLPRLKKKNSGVLFQPVNVKLIHVYYDSEFVQTRMVKTARNVCPVKRQAFARCNEKSNCRWDLQISVFKYFLYSSLIN